MEDIIKDVKVWKFLVNSLIQIIQLLFLGRYKHISKSERL